MEIFVKYSKVCVADHISHATKVILGLSKAHCLCHLI